MNECGKFNPDEVFKQIRLIVFPTTFVGLTSVLSQNIEYDLESSVYLKTRYEGRLMNFSEARDVSPDHRSFEITRIDSHTLLIKFYPTIECIARARRNDIFDNRFMIDLRVMSACGHVPCCNNENHCEVARYYICAQYEFPKLKCSPNILDFGNILMKSTAIKTMEIINESFTVAAKVQYCKEVGFRVNPSKYLIKPKSSVVFTVVASPMTIKVSHVLNFKVMNPHDSFDVHQSDVISSECFDNAFKLPINIKLNVMCHKKPRLCPIESLHKLSNTNIQFSFTESELNLRYKNKEKSKLFINYAKNARKINNKPSKVGKTYDSCVILADKKYILKNEFDYPNDFILTPELIGVSVTPLEVDFKSVVVHTDTQETINIDNNSQIDINVFFSPNSYNISFTNKNLKCLSMKIPAKSHKKVILCFTNNVIGSACGHFEYVINENFKFKHPFRAEVQNPQLYLSDHNFKFGMITSDYFTISAPVNLINKYNIDLYFEWDTINSDTPFKIIPQNGFVSSKNFQMCSIVSNGTVTKAKNHTLALNSCGESIKVELITYTRKVTVKFLESALLLGEIPLNLETIRTISLENSSKQMVHFDVLESPMPGLTVYPMHGNIRPKALLPFEIRVNISCMMEFTAEVLLKVNNKEVITLSIGGNVLEPKIVIKPKSLNIPRIPYGMITYMPIEMKNIGSLRSVIQILNDRTIHEKCLNSDFEICALQGMEMKTLHEIVLESGRFSTVFVKVYDTDRRSYDTYLPMKINNLLGPPDINVRGSRDLEYFVQEFNKLYVNYPKVQIKSVNREIGYCKATGVFSNKVLFISQEHFKLNYDYGASNEIIFSIINISITTIPITILVTKLKPNFTLKVLSKDVMCRISDTLINFDLNPDFGVRLAINFHPLKMGKYAAVADLYIDKAMTIAYHNLTFLGTYETLQITPSISGLYFAPSVVGSDIRKTFLIKSKIKAGKMLYRLDPTNPIVKLLFSEKNAVKHSVEVEIKISCTEPESQVSKLVIYTLEGSECKLPLSYCFTTCPLTLHTSYVIKSECNPYPYYPDDESSHFTKYMNTCVDFLEKWMYQQGFRRELFPVIPQTFHATSQFLIEPSAGSINITIVNFIRRIAGPLAKNFHKTSGNSLHDSKEVNVLKVHKVYEEIILLVERQGALLGMMQAKYLLNFDEFVVYSKLKKCQHDDADAMFDENLINNKGRFESLNKQIWFDLILQSYKVFVFDCCLFQCHLEHTVVGNNFSPVDILLGWFNELIGKEYNSLFPKNAVNSFENNYFKNHKISNFTLDLGNGIAFAAATIHFCPFLKDDLFGLRNASDKDKGTSIIHNALLLIKCWNQIKLYFPIECEDFLLPNYLQMLFLTVHLNVTLPMLKPRDVLEFHPPLLGSSSRHVSISTGSQECMVCIHTLINNEKNMFTVKKDTETKKEKNNRINVKYTANFTSTQSSVLLLQCHNKTRVFDTCVVFILIGYVGSMDPFAKHKMNCPLYKPTKMNIMLGSPFGVDCSFQIIPTEEEPKIPATHKGIKRPQFLVRRVNLMEDVVFLAGTPQETTSEYKERRLFLSVVCMSTETGNSWIWFCGEAGEFYIKITTLPRTDTPQDTLQAKIGTWPIEMCSCGEECECYRTAILTVPYIHYQALHSLRSALLEYASQTMMDLFDQYIKTSTGRLILGRLLEEHGTNMREVAHILEDEARYTISCKGLHLAPRSATLQQHADGDLPLTMTLPLTQDIPHNFLLHFTSECGMDVRTYRVNFYKDERLSV